MQLQPTQTLNQVTVHISELLLNIRQDVFAYIDELRLKYAKTDNLPKKRTAGTLKDKVVFADDLYRGEK